MVPSRRSSIIVQTVVALLAACAGSLLQAAPPNIVFIFSDDHATHAIGAYGGRLAELNPTPNIDKLASQGMLFRNSFCTNSICGPSRAVILTGKHSHQNGFKQNGDSFDGSQQTFPKLLQQQGYQTAMIGKWHLKTEPTGFDHWQILPGQGRYYNPDFRTPQGKVKLYGHSTQIITNLAIQWLESAKSNDKPFLLMCQHKAPHRNWMPGPEYLSLYEDIDVPEPDTLFDRWEDNASAAHRQEMTIADHMYLASDLFLTADVPGSAQDAVDMSGLRNLKLMTPSQRRHWLSEFAVGNQRFRNVAPTGKELVKWKYQRYMKNYLRCVRGVDDSVGRIMEYLRRSGLEKNTIVVYSSDQGFFLGDHGWYDKRWMYEESFQMPLIVKWPKVTQSGSVCTELVQNLDYAETFLEAAGAELPADMQGRSLVPLLRGEQIDDWRKSLYYHFYASHASHKVARHNGVRTQRHKLIHFYDTNEWEFYDLQADPDEVSNSYPQQKDSVLVTELKEELTRLETFYEDDTVTGMQ